MSTNIATGVQKRGTSKTVMEYHCRDTVQSLIDNYLSVHLVLEMWKSRDTLSCTAQSPNFRLSGSVTVTQGRTALRDTSTAPSVVSSSMHSSHASYRGDTCGARVYTHNA